MIRTLALALLLGGCAAIEPPPLPIEPVDVYSRAEIDALNTRIVCKQAARSQVQIARCDVR